MGVFEWSPVYETGVESIDTQHRYLMNMVNDMFAAVVLDNGEAVIDMMLDRLVKYTRRHFAFEEALLRRGGDPGYDEHCAKHRELLGEVEELAARRGNGSQHVDEDTLDLLCDWLTCHIRDEDTAHARYMRRGSRLSVVESVAA